jgi:hypothetical protein
MVGANAKAENIMQELRDAFDADEAGLLPMRSPVRCGLCNLPVVRSLGAPPVLLHQVVASHGSARAGAVDFYFADGACPLEGAPIPDEVIAAIPPATL